MMLRRTFSVLAIALVAAVAVPAAASADPYVSGATVSADRYVLAPGENVTVTWSESFFESEDPVMVSVAGAAAESSIMSVGGSAERGASQAMVADQSGGAVAQVTFTAGAVGSYTIMGTSPSAEGGVTINVVAATSALGAQAIPTAGDLASTGGSLPLGILITGGGMLILGAVLIAARLITRRRTETSAHFTAE